MIRVLALFALFFVVHVAHAQTTTPQSPHPDAVSVFDTIPDEWVDEILAGTFTTALDDQIEEAAAKACNGGGGFGVGARLSFPTARYPICDINLSTDSNGCDGLQLVGTESGVRGINAPEFVATCDRVGTTLRDGMIFVSDTDYFSIKGFILNMNNTYGDGLRLELCRFCSVTDNYFTGVKGAPWSRASSGAATNVIGISDMLTEFVVGDRVEFVADDDGGVLPGGISAATPYWIVSKVGSNVQISTSPGGAVLDITTSVSNFMVHGRTITHNASAVDPATDTWTINNHGIPSGAKVEWVSVATTPTIDGLQLYGRKLWAVNTTTNTLQFSTEPGGAAVNITGAGTNGQKFTRSSSLVIGGSALYLELLRNRMVDDDGRCLSLQYTNVEDPGASFYGANGSDIEANNFNCTVQVSGALIFTKNRIEGAFGLPAVGAFEASDNTSLNTVVVDGYWEGVETGPNSYVAISTLGPANAVARVERNLILGVSAAHVNSGCFRISSIPAAGSFVNNTCRGVAYCFNDPPLASYLQGSSAASGTISGNWCPSGSTEGLPQPSSTTANASTRPTSQIEYPVSRMVWQPGGSQSLPMVDGSAINAIDFAEAVIYQYRGAWALTSKSNSNRQGDHKIIIAETAGSSADAVFDTPWNQSLELRAGEVARFITDRNGLEMAEYRMGQVMQHFPDTFTGKSGNIAAAGIFGGNLPAALYEVCTTVIVTTAGSAGTMDVDVLFNDGTASRTLTTVNDIALDATSYGQACVQVVTNGSSDIQYATTQTAAAGSPVYTLRGTVAMKQ